jgi:hypothetical protein
MNNLLCASANTVSFFIIFSTQSISILNTGHKFSDLQKPNKTVFKIQTQRPCREVSLRACPRNSSLAPKGRYDVHSNAKKGFSH